PIDLWEWRRVTYEEELRSGYDYPADLISTVDGAKDTRNENAFDPVEPLLRADAAGPGADRRTSRHLLKLNDAMFDEWGFDLDSLFATINSLIGMSTQREPAPPIAQLRRVELVNDIASWSGLQRERVEAAVDRLTISPAQLVAVDLAYWHIEQRAHRITLRPIVGTAGEAEEASVWVLPRTAHNFRDVLFRYLEAGRLPWPHRVQPESIRNVLAGWRSEVEDQLEVSTLEQVRRAGMTARRGIKPSPARKQGIDLSGEVDVLAADLDRRRIWVIECKHLYEPFSPTEMMQNVIDFHGTASLPDIDPGRLPEQSRSKKPRFVEKLLGKAAAISASKVGALQLLNVPTEFHHKDWTVTPLFVTSHVEVAAFVRDPRIAFTLPHRVADVMNTSSAPDVGWSQL
ncbi:MAG: hypothetical protein QOJ03_3232, partial [Frankiaceae bacterium]|nr:hypothetical protein [Frankiaceae bacterium]